MPLKYYLVTGEQRDGEHEHVVHCLVRARSQESLDKALKKIFKKEDNSDYAFDHPKSFFGYGDSLTITREKGVQEITKAEADVLQRLAFSFYQ